MVDARPRVHMSFLAVLAAADIALLAWLKDKRIGSKFALPALYQPMSLIPLEIWKSAPSTTNGNEQAHRNINRDGVNLTMLGGIMRAMQYDARAMGTLELHSSQGIYSRDQTATHFRRLQRSLNRHRNYSFDIIMFLLMTPFSPRPDSCCDPGCARTRK